MPRFYFHFRNATGASIDQHGLDLPNVAVARREAFVSVHEITSEALVVDILLLDDAILEVVDQAGEIIATISFPKAAAGSILEDKRNGVGTRH